MSQLPSQPEDSLAAIMPAALAGDRVALERLFEQSLPWIQKVVDREAGPRLRQLESCSDLVQSVCREVLDDLRRQTFEFRSEAEFRQWLQQATLHKVQGRARYFGAQKRDGGRQQCLDGAPEPQLIDSHTPSRDVVGRENAARFRAAMQQLDQVSREVIELAYFAQLPHRDVAARLGVSEAHSRVLLSRALARVARIAAR